MNGQRDTAPPRSTEGEVQANDEGFYVFLRVTFSSSLPPLLLLENISAAIIGLRVRVDSVIVEGVK